MPSTVFVDHTFSLPLSHDHPNGERIEGYAREVRTRTDLPWLLYLNGGPGFPAPRVHGDEGWLRRALADYRVLLLDQRGTGRSTPLNRHTLPRLGPHLHHFRADSIVRDAELIRRSLLGNEPWSVLGQSFGGYCTVTYLSLAPEGLREAIITGGLPGVEADADTVYRHLYPVVAAKTKAHYARFPGDRDQVRRVIEQLNADEVRLPGGRLLTADAFRLLGNLLGSSTGSRQLHYLLEDPFTAGRLSDAFLMQVERELSWASTSPIYSLLHEATYAQHGRTNWSGERVRAEFPDLDFLGEMIYPWMFDNDPLLRPFHALAHDLAQHHWPALYDLDRLRANEVPVAAAIYADDLYIARDLSLATAELIRGLRPWLTADHGHDGLRVSNGAVLDHLLTNLRRG
ncbi:alpha/beta fold hydrolase [Amycolatopsis magusensis]|uniref:alpha/beta fold hydrolase n=1 Tax=Amycolatopsis magusensis TaxID=882444 RepID=UPI0024A8376F|nr:alpha/beta fold hydrolase [Amycolatopsis magusensis]MDI5975265.1 alpha/beta fold hydrolase [Amycolatopsis magusensis]